MKEICLIAAYTPNQEKQDVLRNLIRRLKKFGKKTILISHSGTPQDIILDCDYFFYDSDNEFLYEKNIMPWFYGKTSKDSKMSIVSRDTIKRPTTLLPCTRNLFFGLSLSKTLGYEVVHYIEYDTEIDSIDFINTNSTIIKDYDAIYYKHVSGYKGLRHMFGPYSVYNLKSFTYDEISWDREKIIKEMQNPESFLLVEKVVERLLMRNKKTLVRDVEESEFCGVKFDTIKSHSGSDVNPKILYHEDGKIKLYANNIGTEEENIDVIVFYANEERDFFTFGIKGGWWNIRDIGFMDKISRIKLYCNDNLLLEYTFMNSDQREEFKKNNFVTYSE